MKRILNVLMLGAVAAALAACSASEEQRMKSAFGMATPTPPSGTLEQNTLTVSATVVSIDHAKRTAVLQGPDGDRFTVKVDPSVPGLEKVKAGDTVAATYYESVVYQVRRAGQAAPGVNVAAAGDTTAPGQLPAAAAGRAITITSTIVGIDEKKGTVTLQPPDGGEPLVVKVQYPDRLRAVQKGDLVEVTYTEAIAIGVERR